MLKQIEERLRYEGADMVGAAYIKNFLPENLQHLPYGISVEIRLSRAIVAQIAQDCAPSHTYFHNYRTLNAMLDRCTFLAVSLLQRAGYQAIAVPASQTVDRSQIAGLVSHKMVAAEAGLGRIGRHALFISKDFGPAVRLATVLTDCPVCEKISRREQTDECGSCRACVAACPAGAILGKEYAPGMPREELLDAQCCSNYMKKAFQMIGRGAVCGICMSVCQKRWEEKFQKNLEK